MRVAGLHPHKRQLQKTTGSYSKLIEPFDSFILAFDPHIFYFGNLEKKWANVFLSFWAQSGPSLTRRNGFDAAPNLTF